jgi:hypothetical protein
VARFERATLPKSAWVFYRLASGYPEQAKVLLFGYADRPTPANLSRLDAAVWSYAANAKDHGLALFEHMLASDDVAVRKLAFPPCRDIHEVREFALRAAEGKLPHGDPEEQRLAGEYMQNEVEQYLVQWAQTPQGRSSNQPLSLQEQQELQALCQRLRARMEKERPKRSR